MLFAIGNEQTSIKSNNLGNDKSLKDIAGKSLVTKQREREQLFEAYNLLHSLAQVLFFQKLNPIHNIIITILFTGFP